MIIRKIRMVNFRNFSDKTIEFNDKSVILLSAANGVGKTTTIDGIEWCLTGNIGRLKEAFDIRSTNDTERKINTDGILKNRDSSPNDKVKVVLWMFDGEMELCLCREQIRDELSPELSKVTLNGDEKKAEVFINDYVGDSFYNFHFCDIQKSFNVQNKKRKDLKDFFNEFITNYDNQKQIATNLEIFADDVDRYIKDKTNQKVNQDLLKEREKHLYEVRKNTKNILYPEITFYPNEKLEITVLGKEDLESQKNDLKNCAYQVVKEKTSKLIKNEELTNQKKILEELNTYWKTKRKSIEFAIKEELAKDNKIETIEMEINKIKELSFSKATIFKDIEVYLSYDEKYKTYSNFTVDKKTIGEKENSLKSVIKEIELLTKNNKLLQLYSSLSVNKPLFIEYRNTILKNNEIAKCPVCGSESFSYLKESYLLKETEEYIKQNGELVKEKEKLKKTLEIEIEELYQRIINQTKDIIENEVVNLEKQIDELKALKLLLQPYFNAVVKLQRYEPEVKFETLTDERIISLLNNIEGFLLSSEYEQNERKSYQQILMLIGYDFTNETIQQTYVKMENLCKQNYELSNFSYDILASKINAIDNILANKELFTLKQQNDADINKNLKLDQEISELKKLKEKAEKRSSDIKQIVEELSTEEYENVGPILSKFYNKLIRINSNDGINIVQEQEGISIIDDKKKNIVNVLSNGQINVFMLAHFFAGINARAKYEKMKIYFIDDLTACMDDVNMLAFMDLLKYQMSNKTTMEQLFFITCDDRISNLFKYKMNGRKIDFCKLSEIDFLEI